MGTINENNPKLRIGWALKLAGMGFLILQLKLRSAGASRNHSKAGPGWWHGELSPRCRDYVEGFWCFYR